MEPDLSTTATFALIFLVLIFVAGISWKWIGGMALSLVPIAGFLVWDSLQEKLDGKVNVFKSRWESSMKDQIAELPPFEKVHRELGKHFRALFK